MEEVLITIHTSNKNSDSGIDFGVFPRVDKLSDADRDELLEVLERLASRLKDNKYPFSRK